MEQGVLFIVCGPSGVGKTSLCQGLLERRPRLIVSTSYTTRAPRGDEIDGIDYHFVDVATFETMREAGLFAEWAEVHANYYGTAVGVIHNAWEAGKDVLFDIDYQGARQLQARFPDACSVLIMPPDMATLEGRLRRRATDSEAVIAQRLRAAHHELGQYELFDYIVENDDLDNALNALLTIYDACRYQRFRRVPRLRAMLGGA
ncbi:MAG: guanylate kinase [Bradymonadaceae bacterium]|nr:guanylate kinase [Lujinxingiaceae bacterium]